MVHLSFCFLFYLYGVHRDLHVLTHSFPPRRSSDLPARRMFRPAEIGGRSALALGRASAIAPRGPHGRARQRAISCTRLKASQAGVARSEEHTSELQSLMRISYAVFCLKKKNTL